MAVNTFNRKELKYFVNNEQYERILKEISGVMEADKFCEDGSKYMIYNIYFDTADNSIIRHSISKPYYKEKLRLRSYKMPTSGEDTVYLELKRKIGGIVAKRRAVMTYDEAMKFINLGIIPKADKYRDGQVLEEIAEFLSVNTVMAKVYISYERKAFFHKEDKEFRVSFDKNILTRRYNVDLVDGDYGDALLENGRYLMEVKCSGAVPLWFCKMLSKLEIYKTGFSKYGEEYKQFVDMNRRELKCLA